MKKERWEAVFWDFDGVILDSVNVKTEAFAQMFRKYGDEIEKKVIDYHHLHGGISRYEKFRYYYENLLKTPVTEDELQFLGQEFSRLVLQKVINAPFIPGAFESLKLLKKKQIPCYVVSGAPEKEISFIIEFRSLEHFFDEIHGAPKIKENILLDVLLRKKYSPAHCLYLGDAMTDYKAADKTGVCFHGIVPQDTKSPFPEGTPICCYLNK